MLVFESPRVRITYDEVIPVHPVDVETGPRRTGRLRDLADFTSKKLNVAGRTPTPDHRALQRGATSR